MEIPLPGKTDFKFTYVLFFALFCIIYTQLGSDI